MRLGTTLILAFIIFFSSEFLPKATAASTYSPFLTATLSNFQPSIATPLATDQDTYLLKPANLKVPHFLALVGNEVWITSEFNNTIVRINPDGSPGGTDITGNGMNRPRGILIVGQEVWIANNGGGSISKFNRDGSPAGNMAPGTSYYGMALVGDKIWTVGQNYSVNILNLDGTLASPAINGNGLSNPHDIAVVGQEVWVVNTSQAEVGVSHGLTPMAPLLLPQSQRLFINP